MSPPGMLMVKRQSGPSLFRAMGKRSPAAAGAPSKATGNGTKKGDKDNKKGQKRCPQRVAVTTSCNNDV
jgi:hypothetical protein